MLLLLLVVDEKERAPISRHHTTKNTLRATCLRLASSRAAGAIDSASRIPGTQANKIKRSTASMSTAEKQYTLLVYFYVSSFVLHYQESF